MAFTNTKESGLESLIVKWLVEQNGYEEGTNADYNKEYAVDETRLFRFLEDTQPKEMDKLGVFKSDVKKRQFLNRLSLYTSQYQLQYQLTIRERDYTYNTSDLQGFINAMRYIRSEWSSLQSDFNCKVDSFNRSNHEICLVALSGTRLDTFFTKIDNSIRICETIIAKECQDGIQGS